MISEIELLQPYHHGDQFNLHPLWILNKLANINKHRRLLVVTMKSAFIGRPHDEDRYIPVPPRSTIHNDIQAGIFMAFNENEMTETATPEVGHVISCLILQTQALIQNFNRFFA